MLHIICNTRYSIVSNVWTPKTKYRTIMCLKPRARFLSRRICELGFSGMGQDIAKWALVLSFSHGQNMAMKSSITSEKNNNLYFKIRERQYQSPFGDILSQSSDRPIRGTKRQSP